MNTQYFVVIALLISLYEVGKKLGLASPLIMLLFGLPGNNWDFIKNTSARRFCHKDKVAETQPQRHAITGETAFVIPPFFFILIGFTIKTEAVNNKELVIASSSIVGIMVPVPILYNK